MDKEEIFTRVKGVISQEIKMPAEEITWGSTFTRDLGMDNIQLAEIAFLLEEHFGIEISQEEFMNLRRVEDAVRTIEALLQQGGI